MTENQFIEELKRELKRCVAFCNSYSATVTSIYN